MTDTDGNSRYEFRDSGTQAVRTVVADAVSDSFHQADRCGVARQGNGQPVTSVGSVTSGAAPHGVSDAWAAGYAAQASVVVWAGTGDSVHALPSGGLAWSTRVQQAWHRLMAAAGPAPGPCASAPHTAPSPAQDAHPDCLRQRCIALTFDDGPGPYTEQLLNELDAAQVKATFFLIGENIVQHPDAVRREVADGMAIGNHTWDHQDISRMTLAQQRDEITRTENAFHDLTGGSMTLLRPPDGAHNAATSRLGLPIVLWDVDTQDWMNRSSTITRQRALAAQAGSIVIMHDIQPSTVAAIPGIIAALRAQGYVFVTVPQLYGHLTAGRQYFSLRDIEQ